MPQGENGQYNCHGFSSAIIIALQYSVKGDRIQAAMYVAAWPGFWGEICGGRICV